MRVVVDANIVASALVRPGGWTARELARVDADWFVPDLLRLELAAHEEVFAGKAGVALDVWRQRVAELVDDLIQVPAKEREGWWDHPRVRAAEGMDPDDAIYVATGLAVDADLVWTRDRHLLDALAGWAVTVVPGVD